VHRRLYINVRDFRADGDNDDGASIMRAGAYAKSLRSLIPSGEHVVTWQRRQPVLHFPANLDFEIAEPVTIPGNVSVIMDSPVVVTAAANATPADFGDYAAWIDIGEDVVAYNRGSRWCRYDLSLIRRIQSDWSDIEDLGLRLQNIQSSAIRLNRVTGFARNVEFFAGAFCIAFNQVTIGDLRGAKYHISLNAGPKELPFNDQFVNHNQFHGGELANGGGEGSGTSAIVGWWLMGGNDNAYNSNNFYDQSYEFTTSGERLPVWIEGYATGCNWEKQRTEGCTTIHARIDHPDTTDCVFEDGYYGYDASKFSGRIATIEDDSETQANVYRSLADLPKRHALIPVWDSGLIARKSNQYDGSSQYAVGGFDITTSDFAMYAAQDRIDISGDVVRHEAGRDLVRWIDTSGNSRFVFFVDVGDSTKTYVPVFKPYGSGGSALTDNPANPYVRGATETMFSWNAGLYSNGGYIVSDAVKANFFFVRFRPEVKKAAFCLRGGGTLATTPWQLKSVKIMALDSPCATWVETRAPFDNGEYIGTAVPTSGTYKRGTRVLNHTPSASGVEGWVCVTAGSPGTWKTFGAVGA